MTEQQRKEMEEKIKNMSPEELREFQKQQCIFCQIMGGKIPAKKVYDDDKCVAILDKFPAIPGHLLVIPKEHYMIMPQVPEDVTSHIFQVAKALSLVLIRALKIEGTNIFVANGASAGQKAQHFMVHVIPRKDNDGINLDLPQQTMDVNQFNQVKQILAEAVKEKMPEGAVQATQVKQIVQAENHEDQQEEKEVHGGEQSESKDAVSKAVQKDQKRDEVEDTSDQNEGEEIDPDQDNSAKKGLDLDAIANFLGK